MIKKNIVDSYIDKKTQKEILKIPIFKNNLPMFFIQNHLNDKNYRISASFKYLNTQWGLAINIYRDLKIINKLQLHKLDKECVEVIHQNNYNINNINYILRILKITCGNNVVFLIKKYIEGEDKSKFNGASIAFFSMDNNSYAEFIKNLHDTNKVLEK